MTNKGPYSLLINKIYDRLSPKSHDIRLVLPENNSRIAEAKQKLKELGFHIVELDNFKDYSDIFFEHSRKLKFAKNWPVEKLREYIQNPINFGVNIVRSSLADALIAGSNHPTSDIARSALRFIGLNNKSNCLSSSFLMVSPSEDKYLSYADCAIIPEPTEVQLADIAYDTALSHSMLTQEIPKVAFLSFSTNSSADHYRVVKVKKAIEIFKRKYSDILHEDCEVQFDAAICPEIAEKKYSKSILRGEANVLIYPNLDAGNIAYKITQRIGKYRAFGPLLQGLSAPVHDLSRGCNVDDIVDISIIAAFQGMYANI